MKHTNTSNANARRAMNRSAFTIVEIIVVVIIIGVLAAVVAPRVLGRVVQGKIGAAQSMAGTLANQVGMYQVDIGKIPEGGDLTFLVERPSDVPEDKWKGYMPNKETLIDPWGNKYVLIMPGIKNKDFDVVSYGADGRPGGTGDDADIVKP